MAAHDAVESVPTIAWNRCPSSVECASAPCPAAHPVATGPVIETVRAVAARQQVVAPVTIEQVRIRAARQPIIAGSTVEDVEPAA